LAEPEPLLAPFVTQLGLGGECESTRMLRVQALRVTEPVGEHDMARADDVAAPALDAVVEAERLERIEVARGRRDEKLLRLKPRGARRRAVAAATARPLLVALSNLAARRRDDAARRLRDRDIVARQRVSHHAAAVDQPHDVVAIAAAPLDEIADRRADRR